MRNRSGKLTAGGVLSIIAGAFGALGGITTAASGVFAYGPAGFLIGIIGVVLGIVAIVGGSYALGMKNFGWAIAGGICALLSAWLFGIPALILIALSKGEFR